LLKVGWRVHHIGMALSLCWVARAKVVIHVVVDTVMHIVWSLSQSSLAPVPASCPCKNRFRNRHLLEILCLKELTVVSLFPPIRLKKPLIGVRTRVHVVLLLKVRLSNVKGRESCPLVAHPTVHIV
jgi:hypothetical protein